MAQQLRQRIDALDEQLGDELLGIALLGPFMALAWLGLRTRKLDWSKL